MRTAMRVTSIAASLLLVIAGIAAAQVVKKYVTPDGKTIYSDVPVPGAREVGEVAPPPPTDPEARRKAEEAARSEAERAQDTDKGLQKGSEQQARIQAAEAALEEARSALANGKEPLPDERIGVAGGGTRLNEAYYQRQKANERAVVNAQKRLDDARAGR
jgi:hypothetical protein